DEIENTEEFSPFNFPPLKNSEVLNNLEVAVKHLSLDKKNDLIKLILDYKHLFKDTPGKTNLINHDINVGDADPIKQHPYRMHPEKLSLVRKEINYMLENDLIEPSNSNWSSPIVVVTQPDKSI
ncbi:hypothetical protein, partial [Klebsiella pneumoniae]|uniref:hypothetical protein n=1 Tax=Klebsiella pneumoniae TaxID=573 RepID=UPI003EBADF26